MKSYFCIQATVALDVTTDSWPFAGELEKALQLSRAGEKRFYSIPYFFFLNSKHFPGTYLSGDDCISLQHFQICYLSILLRKERLVGSDTSMTDSPCQFSRAWIAMWRLKYLPTLWKALISSFKKTKKTTHTHTYTHRDTIQVRAITSPMTSY